MLLYNTLETYSPLPVKPTTKQIMATANPENVLFYVVVLMYSTKNTLH